jgi:release factor H-coupled RctB family protein
MRGRVTESAKEMARTAIGSVVVCGDEGLMREEHHTAYKAVDRVLADLKENNLATDLAKLLPVLTYKSERTKEVKENKRAKEDDWRRERHKANRR